MNRCHARSPLRLPLLALLLGLAPAAPAQDLYQWTDADGVTQFSDTPPPPDLRRAGDGVTVGEWLAGQEEAERRARREAMRAAIEAASAPAEPEGEETPAQPWEQARERVESPYTCEEARDILAAQQRPGTRLYAMNEEGRFVRSTEEEVQATIAEWQQAVATLCREDIELVRPDADEAGDEGQAAADGGPLTQ